MIKPNDIQLYTEAVREQIALLEKDLDADLRKQGHGQIEVTEDNHTACNEIAWRYHALGWDVNYTDTTSQLSTGKVRSGVLAISHPHRRSRLRE